MARQVAGGSSSGLGGYAGIWRYRSGCCLEIPRRGSHLGFTAKGRAATSGPLAPYWLFMLGGLFIAVTLLLPRGVVGTWQSWMERRRSAAAAGAGAAPPAPQAAE